MVQNPWPAEKATITILEPNKNGLLMNDHIQIENAKISWLH